MLRSAADYIVVDPQRVASRGAGAHRSFLHDVGRSFGPDDLQHRPQRLRVCGDFGDGQSGETTRHPRSLCSLVVSRVYSFARRYR